MLCRMANDQSAGPDLRGKQVWAIDTLSRVYQLFHALPEMSSPDGRPVSAVYGLTRDLLDIVEKKKPAYLFCAMDAPGPTFRHEKFADYKATRAEMPADLVPQIPLVRRLFDVMEIPCLEVPGFEADDLLATLATKTAALGGECVLATADKDARQLLGDRVRLLNLRTNALVGPEELLAEWGMRPDQIVDFLALVGDAVDNVPGIPGIGPKIAAELLQRYGTLDRLLEHGDLGGQTAKMRALLEISRALQANVLGVTPELVAAARAAGAGDQDIHDAVLITAAFCMYNRYVEGLGTREAAEADYEPMGRRLRDHGYAGR